MSPTPPDAQDPKDGSSGAEHDGAGHDEELRARAEARAESEEYPWDSTEAPLSVEEAREVLHDLRVHQIEIEMQNEELRRAQVELEASRERYFELFDLAPVAYLTLDESGTILEVNFTAVSLLGQDRSRLVGQPFTQFIQPASQDTYYRHRKALDEAGSTQTCEVEMTRGDGTAFVGRVVSTPATGPEGQEVSRVVVSDVTELREEEARQLKLEHRLQQAEKVESLGRMAGAISHHFNNLLAVMIGNLELVMSEVPADTEPDGRLDDALSAARSAAEVSGMLLSYVGQANEEQGPRDLSRIIRQSLPILRAAMPAGIELQIDLPESGPTSDVNVGQIRQVFQNLVTNAWEAAGRNAGTVRVALREVSGRDIPTTNRFPQDWSPSKERYAILSVTDTGGGVDRSHIEQIFDPFFSSKEFGRGLGLSVAFGAVKAHGGVIVVTHPPGGGTTMEVYLPVSEQPRPTRTERPKRERAGRSGREHVGRSAGESAGRAGRDRPEPATPPAIDGVVLLVDDEPMLRSLGSRMLSRLGFEVVTAGDGGEALEVFDEYSDRIACVICDLTMPKMNGWETLTALRGRRPDLPVVLTSGFDEAHAMAGNHPERPQVFMSKPWSGERFQEAIETAIESASA